MYHIWKISKIISSETRGNLTGRNETQSSEAHHNITTPPDSPPPQLHSTTGLLTTGTKLLYTAEDTCLLRLW